MARNRKRSGSLFACSGQEACSLVTQGSSACAQLARRKSKQLVESRCYKSECNRQVLRRCTACTARSRPWHASECRAYGSAGFDLLTGLASTCCRSSPACSSAPCASCAGGALSPCGTPHVIGEGPKAAEGGRRNEQQSISFFGATSRTVCASTSVGMHAQHTQHAQRIAASSAWRP